MIRPVLSYIADLLSAVLMFLFLLLAAWGLYYWGNTLRMPGFAFFLRIVGLAVLSFGTFWCIVVILKRSIRLFLPREVESSRLRQLSEPVRKSPILLFVCSGIVTAVLYINISFAELVRDNCDDMSLLSCELLCETGPYFPVPVPWHEKMLKDYARYMEQKPLAGLLKIFSEYDPSKVLTSASDTLKSGEGQEEKTARAIWQAGENIMLFRLKTSTFLPREITLHKYRKVPKWLSDNIKEAINDSREASALFEQKPSLKTAVKSCEDNRRTMLLLFLARSSYSEQDKSTPLDEFQVAGFNFPSWIKGDKPTSLDEFQEIVEKARDGKKATAGLLPGDDPRKEFLNRISQSEQRRFDILEALKHQDLQKAVTLMWDEIDRAYREKTTLLELCSKVRNEDYSKEITP